MAVAWHASFLPILATGGAFLGVFLKQRFTCSRDQWAVLVVVLAVFCGLHQYVAPFEVDREPMVFPPSMALPTTEFILLIQVVAFFRRSVEDRLPAFLPGAGAIYLTIVTDVMPGEFAQRTNLLALVAAFIVSATLFLILRSASARAGERIVRRRRGATIVAVSAVAFITWISASLLYGFGGQIDTLLAQSWFRHVAAVDLGFSSVARLGTVARCKSFRSDSVALRIASNDSPGYLRGKVFDEFHNSDWLSVAGGRLVPSTDTILAGMTPPLPGEHIFHLQDGRKTSRCVDVTWSQKDLGELLFAPLGAVGFKTSTMTVSVNRHDVAQTVNNLLETPYQVAVSDERLKDALTPELKARLLAVPRTLDPRIHALATRLFASRATKDARISAVQAFFRDNFQYSLEIDIPLGKEPLAFFLFQKRSADCEYFATAAVMLLRLGGIPCRYVTGFLAVRAQRLQRNVDRSQQGRPRLGRSLCRTQGLDDDRSDPRVRHSSTTRNEQPGGPDLGGGDRLSARCHVSDAAIGIALPAERCPLESIVRVVSGNGRSLERDADRQRPAGKPDHRFRIATPERIATPAQTSGQSRCPASIRATSE